MVNCGGKGNPLLPSEIDLPLLCACKSFLLQVLELSILLLLRVSISHSFVGSWHGNGSSLGDILFPLL